jgi:aminopeptidase-like protein
MMNTAAPDKLDLDLLGQQMHALIGELYPICRSITGDGVRETLRSLQRFLPLTIHEVPTGTPVFDWTVPREWNIHDAYVKNSRGERVIDFQKSNLHVMNYSVPVHKKMSLEELKPHLFTLPDHPDWIPYRTSYYKENWGFCLSHKQFLEFSEGEYEVSIEASLKDGHLTYGELVLPGVAADEILVSCHVCHPSLANDNLSGIAVACFLARQLAKLPRKFSYRFLFIPGTIGAITWLCINEPMVFQIKHGLVLAGVGDAGPLSYKRSRRGDTEIDRAAAYVLRQLEPNARVLDFSPYGYDERQYCSPGFNLAVGRLSRTPHGTFPEYHTSADNLSFVHPHSLSESFSACLSIFSVLERNRTYLNTNPKCEPQLGARGLYRAVGGSTDSGTSELAMLWILNLSDGGHTLLDIAERAQISFDSVHRAAIVLEEHGLLQECFKQSPAVTSEAASRCH